MNQSKNESQNEIDVQKSWDVNFWCEELNLHEGELREIVGLVGPDVHDVRVHLAKNLLLKLPLTY